MLGRTGALMLCAALRAWAGVPQAAWADDTGLKVATAIAAAGSWTNCTVAYLNASENNRASTGTNDDYCVPSTFAFGVSVGATINGIEVQVEGSYPTGGSTVTYAVQLSWDAGTSWTTAKSDTFTSNIDVTDTLGGAADTWGRTWTVSDFSDANFQLRVYRTVGTSNLRVDRI